MSLWESKNGKWVIENIQHGGTKIEVHCKWLTKNTDVTVILNEVHQVVEVIGMLDYKVPKYIYQNAKQLTKGNSPLTAAPTMTMEAPTLTTNVRTVEGLTRVAKQFLKEKFDLELRIPIKVNGRLTRALGRFRYFNNPRSAKDIEISKKTLQYHTEDTIIDILKHELVHYALFTLGKPHKDGHPVFEHKLKELGITGTNIIPIKGKVHTYDCGSCGKEVVTRRKLDPYKLSFGYYTSKCCNAKLTYKGEAIK